MADVTASDATAGLTASSHGLAIVRAVAGIVSRYRNAHPPISFERAISNDYRNHR